LLNGASGRLQGNSAASSAVGRIAGHTKCRLWRFAKSAQAEEMNGDTKMLGQSGNPTLAELIQDPLVQLIMRSDRVDQSAIEALFARVAQSRQTPRAGNR
jgi:hypothetical protein